MSDCLKQVDSFDLPGDLVKTALKQEADR